MTHDITTPTSSRRNWLKTSGLAVFAAVALSACATGPTPYGPAASNGMGFENTRIESDRFRIAFTGRSAQEANNLALLRAAEIADAEGYPYFRVLGGFTEEDRGSSGISSSIGIGFGGGRRGYYGGRSGTSVGIGIGINDVVRALNGKKVRQDIEVRLLQTPGGDRDTNVYKTADILQNLRPEVFQ